MNKAKSREELPAATCENPVAKQFELGQLIGVNGTPAIVLGNGQMIPGYQPAPQLAKLALEAK
jgi:thiol:disulfide interchange protein DsbC